MQIFARSCRVGILKTRFACLCVLAKYCGSLGVLPKPCRSQANTSASIPHDVWYVFWCCVQSELSYPNHKVQCLLLLAGHYCCFGWAVHSCSMDGRATRAFGVQSASRMRGAILGFCSASLFKFVLVVPIRAYTTGHIRRHRRRDVVVRRIARRC